MTPAKLATLARRAVAHVELAADLSGHVLPARRNHAALDALAAACRPVPAARREWLAAVALWWRMAETARPVCRGYARLYSITEADDLTHEGMIGAFDAAQVWNPERGPWSATYRQWVRSRIHREHNGSGYTIRVPDKSVETMRIAGKARERMEQAGAEVTAGTVRAAVTGVAEILAPCLEAALSARYGVRSISAPVAGDGISLGDTLAAEPWDPADDLDTIAAMARVREALAVLPAREAAVVHRRYWMDEPGQVAARAVGLTRGSERNAHSRALARLRDEVAA